MSSRVIVALDHNEPATALAFARSVSDHVQTLKVGLTLFAASGPGIVDRLREYGFDVFVDLKYHDIPHQVAGATRELACLGASMFTVHAGGGRAMIEAAVAAATKGAEEFNRPRPKVLAVTVLTSLSAEALAETGVADSPADQVARLARLAMDAGADGVVCSPEETRLVRTIVGPDALVVTPGVRPTWAEIGDQARIATPHDALTFGASHIVIGRPITNAPDPIAAMNRLLAEIDTTPEVATA